MKQFNSAQKHLLSRNFDWYSDTICAVIVDPSIHKLDYAVDQFLSDIPFDARVAISEPLENKRVTDCGAMTCSDVEFTSTKRYKLIVDGYQLALFKQTGNEGQNFLLFAYVLAKDDFSRIVIRIPNEKI